MDVILLEKQRTLGNLGDKVKVKPGFARNFLIPNGKAVRATKENIAHFETRRAELEKAQATRLQEAQSHAEKISQLNITIVANAGEDGKLFGSIGTRDIAEAITLQGIKVEKSDVLLPNGTLRQIGEYNIQVQVHGDILATVKLAIVAEE